MLNNKMLKDVAGRMKRDLHPNEGFTRGKSELIVS
jgi:hypothetical protein